MSLYLISFCNDYENVMKKQDHILSDLSTELKAPRTASVSDCPSFHNSHFELHLQNLGANSNKT